MLFQIFTEREKRRSIAVASNAPFREWSKTFTDKRLCVVIVNRLTFKDHVVETGHKFYRIMTTLAEREPPRCHVQERCSAGNLPDRFDESVAAQSIQQGASRLANALANPT